MIGELRKKNNSSKRITGSDISAIRAREAQKQEEEQKRSRVLRDNISTGNPARQGLNVQMATNRMRDNNPNNRKEQSRDYVAVTRNTDYLDNSKSKSSDPGFIYDTFNDTIVDKGPFKKYFDRKESQVNSIDQLENTYKKSLYSLDKNFDASRAYEGMSDQDKGIYNYLFNTEGKQSADNYLDYYIKKFNADTMQAQTEEVHNFAKANSVLGSVASVGATFLKPAGLSYSLDKAIQGEEIDPNSSVFFGSNAQNTLRNTVKEENNMGKTGSFLYDTGMSLLDSVTASIAGPTGGALLLAGGAGADASRAAKQKGASDKQAALSGLTSAVAEGLFERISLGNLKSLKEVPINSIKDVAMNTLKSIGVNASEEAATELSNIVSDWFIMGDLSDYQQQFKSYLDAGYSEEEAKKATIKDMAVRIGLAAAGGALSGGAMASVGQGVNYATTAADGRQSNKLGMTDAYIQQGLASDQNSEYYKKASALQTSQEDSKSISKYQAGQITRLAEQGAPYQSRIDASMSVQNTTQNAQKPQTSLLDTKVVNSTPMVRNVSKNVTEESFDNLDEVAVKADNYKTNGAKAFTANYDDELDLDSYQKGFSAYYDAGLVNLPMDKISSAYGSLLKESVRMNAYNSGLNDAKMSKVKPVIEGNRIYGVVESQAALKMDADTLQALNELGKISKTEIRIEESIAGGLANGMYRNGVMSIALDSDNPYMTVAKHELTHAIQDSSPELYTKYRDFVISEINKSNPKAYNDMVDNLLYRYTEIGQSITRDEAMDEIVADASEMFLTDPESIERLAKADKSLAEKVIDIIRELIGRMQKALTNLEPRSRAAKALNEDIKSVKEAEKLWIEALSASSENEMSTVPEGARLQLKDIDYSDYQRLYQENRKLRVINNLLNEQFKVTNELTPDKKQLTNAANEILKKAQSSYDVSSVVENLETVWKYVHNHSEAMYTEEAVEAVQSMARMILKKSSATDNTLVENSKAMLEEIKKTPLVVSSKDRADLSSEGGFNNFRRKYFGKIRLVASGGIEVDTFYQGLSEKYPEFFREEITHPADQLIKIAEVIDFIKPINYNPYGMSIEEASRDLAYEIISSAYFNIGQTPATFADKKKAELSKLKSRYNQNVRELREDYKAKYNERLKLIKKQNEEKIAEIVENAKEATAEQKEAYRQQVQKLRDQNLQKLKAQQQRFSERMDNARERRNRTVEANKWKSQIKKISKDLSDMLLKPTEKSHLPKGFTQAIKEVLQILDFESGTLGPNGEPTQAALKWRKLKDEYAALRDNDDDILNSLYFENVESDIRDLAALAEGRRVNQLNHEELKAVYDIIKHIKHLISMENKAFSENIRESISATGNSIITNLAKEGQFTQSSIAANNKGVNAFANMLTKGNIKPYYFFKRIGGEFEKLYKNVRDGEDKFIANFESGNDFARQMIKKHDYFSWADDKPSEFVTEKGAKISLTTDEKLYIYAAYRRRQGKQHILKGGVIAEAPKIETEGKGRDKVIKKVTYQSDPVQFTEKDMERLEDSLTIEQKTFVMDMVDYLSDDLSKLGNEVANKLFGLDAYMEENYIPLTSDRSFLNTRAGVTDDKRIKRMSFTKPTVRNASNPIIATGFMEVWSNHLVDMSMYNALVLPLEDFQKVWNYKYKDKKTGEETSVKSAIKKAYGPEANKYIEKLIIDINGGIKQDVGGELSNWLLAKMKVDAVMGNLSVAIQQPSSLARAFVIIDPKYFIKTTFSKRDYNELLEHSPQAKLKGYGYFDVNMGRSLSDVVTEKEYDTPLEKIKAFFTDKNARNEVFSWLPQKMDEITWSHIWNAVKAETIATTNLQEGTDAYWKHVSDRFKEVIDRSQVMDSVFQRSELMRSQNPFAKVSTNFMAEPTVTYNMLYDAITEYKKNGKSASPYVTRSVAAVISAMVLNSLLKSIITAGRDKDEEKKYGEKYLESFIKNLSDDPLGMIPYVNAVFSTFKGYEPVRPDMQLFQNLYYAYTKLDSNKYTTAQKVQQMAQSIAPFFNVPLKNISKDIEMVLRNGKDFFESFGIVEEKTAYEKLQSKYIEADSSVATAKYYDQLYKAKTDGDTELYRKIYSDLIKSGKKPSTIEEAMRDRKRLGLIIRKKEEEYNNPVLTELFDAFSKKDAKAYQTARKKLLDDGYTADDIQWAQNYLNTEKLKAEAPTPDEFIEAYKTGKEAVWKPLYDKMKAAGWTQKDLLALVK